MKCENLERLVYFNMPHGNIIISKPFKQVLCFEKLKRINLEHCESIQKFPELWAPNLKQFDLSYCKNLVEIHESIGLLDKLETLNLFGCKKLQALPRRLEFKSLIFFFISVIVNPFKNYRSCVHESIGLLDKLKVLDLSFCKRLQALPRRLEFKSLIHFNLISCKSIQELPKLCVPNLEDLNLSLCKNLVEIHESIGLLDKLEVLDPSFCKKLQALPRRLEFKSLELFFLVTVNPFKNYLSCFHESIGLLDKLESWDLQNCGKLQTLPLRLTLKSLKYFDLSGSTSLENFPNIDPKMQCLETLELCGTRIREFPSSNSIYQFQKLKDLSFSTNIPRQTCNSFDGYRFLQLERLTLSGENVTTLNDLDVDYFPKLYVLTPKNTNIVTILESLINFTRLSDLHIVDCKHFEEIQELPQSLRNLKVRNCPSWNLQSSNKILSQGIAKKNANRVHEFSHWPLCWIVSFPVPGSEIPDEFNHQSDGNSISFMVDQNRRFPYIFAVSFALGPTNGYCEFGIYVDVNGFKIECGSVHLEKSESCSLWFFAGPLCEWKKLNLSKQSHLKVIVKMENYYDHEESMDPTTIMKKFGVHVECICCPHKSSIPDSLPLLPLFPTSCNEGDSRHAIAMETTNATGFEYGLKGFQGDLNVSLSIPIDLKVHPLIPLPYSSNMDHEVFKTVSDLGHLKEFHNDGCNLSLSLNDSNASECEPPQVPDTSNGSDFRFGQLDLVGSTVSGGFDLGSSSMTHEFVNDDFDLNLCPTSTKTRTS
ncbi:protein suppressor of npr1-1 [Quercus suber]|uniref:Protein suppressor of npr1-1 n=1 Tax=Quercus suber TaxID=58331 RepID=A0AAW0K9Q4_QUESU